MSQATLFKIGFFFLWNNLLKQSYNLWSTQVPLARAYDVGEIVNTAPVGIWLKNQNGSQASLPEYMARSLFGLTNSTDPRVNFGLFLETAIRYIKLHQELFGVYEGELMPRPTPDTLHRVRGTFQVHA